MCIYEDIKRKAREIIDISEVNSLCDQIIELAGKTQRTGFNYTEGMSKTVDELKELFAKARAEASNLVIDEEDRESEKILGT